MSHSWMTLSQVKQFLPEAKIVNAPSTEIVIKRFISDSRQVAQGDCFIAIRGEKFDAHDFLAEVQGKGAMIALISSVEQLPNGFCGILVKDTILALQELAREWQKECKKHQLKNLVVVTGSNGKTTVKGMIESIFNAAVGNDHALATLGNFNNEIGLPLTLLRLTAQHELAVIELGMNHPGETSLLASIANANIVLINNAQREHQEFMATVEAVAQEHALAIKALPANGSAIFPADSEYSDYWRQLAAPRAVVDFAWGINAKAMVTGDWFNQATNQININTPKGDIQVTLNILGEHNARNALAATAASLAAGLPLNIIKAGLENFKPVNGRMQQHQLNDQTTLIDDTYNANPDSVRAAIDVLAALPNSSWLVLGDMGEVGDQGPEFHYEVGSYAGEKGIKKLFAMGELSKQAISAYSKKSLEGSTAAHFDAVEDLCQALKSSLAQRTVNEATTVLIKGSRFMQMERAVKALVEEIH
jgi:UDP-N-acetylmuramoyl-tripeptide--D-alanyl-D-alanine ligase